MVENAISLATRYLRSRQTASGGFCFYRSEHLEEPSLHDTYHAVSALRLIRAEIPCVDTLADFIATFDVHGLNPIYYGAFALDMLGRMTSIPERWIAHIQEWNVQHALTANGGFTTGNLESLLRLVRLKRRFAELPSTGELAFFVESQRNHGGYGGKPNIHDTWTCLAILELVSAPPANDAAREFIDRLQIANFGFTVTCDSILTDLNTLLAGIRCCRLLDIPIRFGDDVLAFALSCQSSDGGFSRTSGALPNIEQTHRALQIIRLLLPDLFTRR